jgi:hypothetical protein
MCITDLGNRDLGLPWQRKARQQQAEDKDAKYRLHERSSAAHR